MAIEDTLGAPRRYWVGVALAAAFVLFGLVATLGIYMRGDAQNAAMLGSAPDFAFWLLLAIAILGEVIGVLGLLARRTWTTPGFGLSAVFTVLFYAYVLHKSDWAGSVIGPLVITVIHLVLVWFAVASSKRGWTRRGSNNRLEPQRHE